MSLPSKVIICIAIHEFVQLMHFMLHQVPFVGNASDSAYVLALLIIAPPFYIIVHRYKTEEPIGRYINLSLITLNWLLALVIIFMTMYAPWEVVSYPGWSSPPTYDHAINSAIRYSFNLFFFLLFAFIILHKKGKQPYQLLLNVAPILVWFTVTTYLIFFAEEPPEFVG